MPRENEAVLLGAALLGSVAAKKFGSLREAMVALSAPGLVSNFDHHKLSFMKLPFTVSSHTCCQYDYIEADCIIMIVIVGGGGFTG